MSSQPPPLSQWLSFCLLLLTLISRLPFPASGDICDDRCDLHRLPGSSEAYTLRCDEEYDKPSDIYSCRADCGQCISSVCRSSDPNVFHCPPFKRNPQRCEKHCDDIRPPDFDGQAFHLDCSKHYISESEIEKCRRLCVHCPQEICFGSTPDIYQCPSHYGPSPPISGRCLERCDNNRPKGFTASYTLSCSQEYLTVEEVKFCRADCIFCPRSICSPYSPNTYHCPANDSFVAKPDPLPESGSGTWILVLSIIIGVLIIVPCVGACIYCCCLKKKRRVRTEQYSGTSEAAVGYPTYMGGQQQPYPMNINYNYEASQPSVSSLAIDSSALTSKSALHGQ